MEITKATWSRKQDYVIGKIALDDLNALADLSETYHQAMHDEGVARGAVNGWALPVTHPARAAYDDALDACLLKYEADYVFHAATVGQNRVLRRVGRRPNDLAVYYRELIAK